MQSLCHRDLNCAECIRCSGMRFTKPRYPVSDGDIPVLDIWGMWGTSLLLFHPDPKFQQPLEFLLWVKYICFKNYYDSIGILDAILLYTVAMNINGYAPSLINTLDTIVRRVI